MVHLLLEPGLENFEHFFAGMWDECNCEVVGPFLGIAFLWNWNANWPFPVLWPLLSFPNLLTYWVKQFPKAHLTSYSRMSGSRWVITPSLLSGLCGSFLYSSVYFYHLFLISSASVRTISFLSFTMPIFAWYVPLISLIFLKRSLVFPVLLFPWLLCIDHWRRRSYLSLLFFGTRHSNGYSFLFLLCLSHLFFFPVSLHW